MASLPIPVSAAILAGGLGTRLRDVVADRPKALAPVAGRPFLAHLLEQLHRAGVRHTTLLTGYAADQVQAAIGSAYADMAIAYSEEPQSLGTAGALRHALPHLTERTILLLNGDSYCEVDMAELLAFHEESRAQATLTLTQVADSSRYGRVRCGDDRQILSFEEKNDACEAGWINAGVYVLNREVIERIPADRTVSLERDILSALVATGRVSGYVGGRFIDIGTPESYAQAEAFFASH